MREPEKKTKKRRQTGWELMTPKQRRDFVLEAVIYLAVAGALAVVVFWIEGGRIVGAG